MDSDKIFARLRELLERLAAEGADPAVIGRVCFLLGVGGLVFDPRRQADMEALRRLQAEMGELLDMAEQPAEVAVN